LILFVFTVLAIFVLQQPIELINYPKLLWPMRHRGNKGGRR
jgi:hypothetical protein